MQTEILLILLKLSILYLFHPIWTITIELLNKFCTIGIN